MPVSSDSQPVLVWISMGITYPSFFLPFYDHVHGPFASQISCVLAWNLQKKLGRGQQGRKPRPRRDDYFYVAAMM